MKSFRFTFGLLGLMVGFGGGLLYFFGIRSVAAPTIALHELAEPYQQAYIYWVAGGFAADGDRERAETLLRAVGWEVEDLTAYVQEVFGHDDANPHVPMLSGLAVALQGVAEPSTPESPAPSTPTLAPLVSPTLPEPTFIVPSPLPTASDSTFLLQNYEPICDENHPGLLMVMIQDSEGAGVAGISLKVSGSTEVEVFATGLQPEISSGYADVVLAGQTEYTIGVAGRTLPIPNVALPSCTNSVGDGYWGGLRLTLLYTVSSE